MHDLVREKPEQAVSTWRYEQGFRDERFNDAEYREEVLSLFYSLKASAKEHPSRLRQALTSGDLEDHADAAWMDRRRSL